MTASTAADILDRAAHSYRSRTAGEVAAVGIDLGTATCVLVAVDGSGRPVWVDSHPTAAIRDGVVVDFFAARDAVARLTADVEAGLLEQRPEIEADDRLVLGDEDSHAGALSAQSCNTRV